MKLAILRALVVLIPSYTAAYLTGQMVWTIPTMVAAGFFAAALGDRNKPSERVDQESDFKEEQAKEHQHKEEQADGPMGDGD